MIGEEINPTKEIYMENIVRNTKLYLFDMDGTLYLGDNLFDFSKELLAEIRRTGGKYLFMTNNSSKSVLDYVKKLQKLGIEADREDFMTSKEQAEPAATR